MNNSIPRKPRIVDNDMNLSISELDRLGYQCFEILGIRHVACDGDGAARFYAVDGIRYRVWFFWKEEKLIEYLHKNSLISLLCGVLYCEISKEQKYHLDIYYYAPQQIKT
jgi:hypothetical protein